MNNRVRAIISKEYVEYRRNKLIVISMALLPTIFLLLIARSVLTLPVAIPLRMLEALLGQVRLFLLVIPLVLPGTIAAASVITEREQGALEPVLTTPATDGELLAGKALAPLFPAVGISWVLYVIFVVGLGSLTPTIVLRALTAGTQILGEVLLAPLMAGFAIVAGLLISTRTSDIRVAQQLAGVVSIPMLAVVGTTSFSVSGAGMIFYLGLAAILIVIDLVGVALAIRAFSRERLLTRYRG